MSTSLLYHGFGLVGYRFVHTKFAQGRVSFRIEQPRETFRCSACGSVEVWSQGSVERTFRTVPIGKKPVELVFKVPRLFCFGCGLTRQTKLSFAEPKKHCTRSFERYALELSRHMTIKDVAEHLEVGWDTIRGTIAGLQEVIIRVAGLRKHVVRPTYSLPSSKSITQHPRT